MAPRRTGRRLGAATPARPPRAWRRLQATSVMHRLVGLLLPAAVAAPVPVAPWAGAVVAGLSGSADAGVLAAAGAGASVGPVDPAAAAARRLRARLPEPDRVRFDTLRAAAGVDPLAGVLVRGLASGAPVAALEAMAALWPGLAPGVRRAVAAALGRGRPGPLLVGGVPARQTDGTACGSAVLAMLAAAGDPFLALWLGTGRTVPGYVPPELRRVPATAAGSDDAVVRLGALQQVLKAVATRHAVGPVPWPAALGTPPWGAARTARYPGVRYTHVLVDDTDVPHLGRVLDAADAALAAGVPVPVYTGGDLGSGPGAAVPRHVVLLVPGDGGRAGRHLAAPRGVGPDDGRRAGPDRGPGAGPVHPGYAVYEPGSGQVHRIGRDELVGRTGPHPALGGWSHVCWALLPQPADRPR